MFPIHWKLRFDEIPISLFYGAPIRRSNVTVQEASNKLGVSKWALYKMIKQKRGVGAYFKKNKFGVWVVDGRRITRC